VTGIAVVGLQWGDEGKGKIIDTLAGQADIVVRFQGGANAGHTLIVGDQKYVLHLVPAGVLYAGKACLIGNGAVVDLMSLNGEIEALEARGVNTDKVLLSERAHVVMPYHKQLDEAREAWAQGGVEAIGTTKRGIGPCYADKASRQGIRVCELMDPPLFRARLESSLLEKNAILTGVYGREPVDLEPIYQSNLEVARKLRSRVVDGSSFLREAFRRGERVLFEGAQGVMLDVDHGTYPFVTSSSASLCGISAGAGVPPQAVSGSVGVVKAYTTRVGEGPFPTELEGEAGEWLRGRGAEFGATTGRPRRCGTLDLVQVRYAAQLCGVSAIALSKLDVLSGLETIRVAIAYEYEGRVITEFPASLNILERVRPVFRDFPGFDADLSEIETLAQLPREARGFIEFVEQQTGVPVRFVSTGPRRDQFFERGERAPLFD
jgi:adenylosuccinate synthase